jgi:hypothetical protein
VGKENKRKITEESKGREIKRKGMEGGRKRKGRDGSPY